MDSEELREAEAHIARLEEELLRLKDVKRELQVLREEHQRLRRSAHGRVAKILSAPFRLLRSDESAPAKPSEYQRWFARHRVSPDQAAELRVRAHDFAYRPLISILTPAFNSNELHLTEALQSVLDQVYENWELVIVDDGSERPAALLDDLAKKHKRIRVSMEKRHAGISAALNVAFAQARGDYVALLDHDDLLEPDALFRAAEILQEHRDADLIYSDEDKLTENGLDRPLLKPDWSPDLFLSLNYIGHLTLARRAIAREIGGFRSEFDGAQDYDFYWRFVERTRAIHHIPRVLYHWRRTPESTAHNIRRKPGVLDAARSALQQHLERTGQQARVTVDWQTHVFRVRRELTGGKITIVLLGQADQQKTDLIRERTAYPDFDVVTKVSALPESDLLILLDSDLEPLQKNWLAVLAEFAQQPEIGASGARILRVDDTVENAGVVLLPGGKVSGAFAGRGRDFRGAGRHLQTVRNYSAISASCLMMRRENFEKIASRDMAGFLDFARNDRICAGVKCCLKLRDAGLRVVSVPYAEVRRTSRPKAANDFCPELAKRWPAAFARDPFYNPNLSRERADFSLGEARHE
jgi:O-antigen biosynthesis protein